MRTAEVEVYSDASNSAVLRHPGRRFPGMLVQGDSLSTLVDSAAVVVEHALRLKDVDLASDALSLFEDLDSRLESYAQVLRAHGLELPYSSPPQGRRESLKMRVEELESRGDAPDPK